MSKNIPPPLSERNYFEHIHPDVESGINEVREGCQNRLNGEIIQTLTDLNGIIQSRHSAGIKELELLTARLKKALKKNLERLKNPSNKKGNISLQNSHNKIKNILINNYFN